MDTIRTLNHHTNQRVEYDNVITRISNLARESADSLITGFMGGKSGMLVGSLVPAASGLQVILEQGSFFSHRIETTKCVAVAQRKELSVTFDAAEPAVVRKDVIQGRFVRTINNPKIVDIISELPGSIGAISPQLLNVDEETTLEISVLKGDTGTGAPQDLTSADASYTSPIDISSPLDLTLLFQIRLSVDGSTYQTIDLRGPAPISTSITEMVNNINAVYPGLASDDGTNITLTATDSIRFEPPTSNDATEYLFGLSISPDYMHLFERKHPYFKLAEVWIPAAATDLVQEDIYGPDRQKLWTAPADPNDDNDVFDVPNVNQLVETSVPIGAIISIHKDVALIPDPLYWSKCDGVDDLPTERFNVTPGTKVPNLTDDRFLMGATGPTATGGDNDGHYHGISGTTLTTDGVGDHTHPYTRGARGADSPDVGSGHHEIDEVGGTTSGGGAHSHTISGAVGDIGDTLGFDGDAAGSNRPKFFACDFYIRVK
jgi:hypothetical protein